MVQVLAHSTGLPLKKIPDQVCRHTHEQLEAGRQQAVLHLDAIKRMLKREAPAFLE